MTIQQDSELGFLSSGNTPDSIADAFKKLEPFFRNHGNFCLAFSAFRAEMQYFLDRETEAYAAFTDFRHKVIAPAGRRIVLANPVCGTDNGKLFLKHFLDSPHPPMIFLQTDAEWAEKLQEAGFDINQIGLDIRLDMQHFNLKGKHRAQLRHWLNKAGKEGIEVEEIPPSALDTPEYKMLKERWYNRKGGTSKFFFLTRPPEVKNIPGCRIFSGRQKDGRLAAFIIFDPMWTGGRLSGYYHNHIIAEPGIPHGTTDYITIKAAEVFQKEEVNNISLGLAPLAGIEIPDSGKNRFAARISKFIYEHGNFTYPFKNNYAHKKKYGGNEVKVYCCSEKKISFREILTILSFLKVL